MDALVSLLDGPRARGAFALRAIMNPPWAVRIEDRAPLSLVALMRGDAWVIPDRSEPVQLRPGDITVIRGPDPYTFADRPDTAPQVVIHPGQRCATPDGREVHQAMDLGVRTWGNHPAGSTVMLVGTYQQDSAVSCRLLGALPPLLVAHRDGNEEPLISLLSQEILREEPGQEAVLDRLLDVLLVCVLRNWLSRPESDAPAWYRAQGDPVVGRALRMLHNQPAHPWTVASLAAAVGASRAVLARRFTELVGEPPMTFLTGWRLALAADLLRQSDATVQAVAREVGYGSGFALSTAFKRVRGVSPTEHRAAAIA